MEKTGKITKDIATYIKNKETYKNIPFRIKNGIGYYLINGIEIPQKEWEASNPAPEYTKFNPDNPDKTHIH